MHNNTVQLQSSTKADIPTITDMFSRLHEPFIQQIFGNEKNIETYIQETWNKNSLFSEETIKLAKTNNTIAGMCITLDKKPTICTTEKTPPSTVNAMNTEINDIAPYIQNNYTYIFALYVLPEARNQGIASKLLENAIKDRKRILLHCDTNNKAAMNLYKKYGFQVQGIFFGMSEDEDSKLLSMAELTLHQNNHDA